MATIYSFSYSIFVYNVITTVRIIEFDVLINTFTPKRAKTIPLFFTGIKCIQNMYRNIFR